MDQLLCTYELKHFLFNAVKKCKESRETLQLHEWAQKIYSAIGQKPMHNAFSSKPMFDTSKSKYKVYTKQSYLDLHLRRKSDCELSCSNMDLHEYRNLLDAISQILKG